MSETMSSNERAPLHASRIHLLVHPGFAASIHHDELYELNGEPDPEHSPAQQAIYDSWCEKYVAEAARMKPTEILIVYLSRDRKAYRLDREHNYALPAALTKIRSMLGRRMIVLSDSEMTSMNAPEELFEKVKRVASARNIEFDRSTQTIAYGETLESCVSLAANEFNRIGKFTKRTVIDKANTDMPDAPRDVIANLISRSPRTRFPGHK
jgi:hypothetical protein